MRLAAHLTAKSAAALISSLSLHLAFAQQSALPRKSAVSPERAEHTSSLPVTRVSLYKNGVGFFEHTGHVTGDASVTIDFTTGQLNDVLQSLTALDLNGGRITGADYNSTTPLDQQLRSLPLSLDANPTILGFYTAIRGTRIEVRSGPVTITGRLLAVEAGDLLLPVKPGPTSPSDQGQKVLLTIVSDSGDVRTVVVTAATSVRLLDTSLDTNITRYLQLLDANRSQGLRHLTLADKGTGTRELRVSYISEVPIWKSTYRILFSAANATAANPTATLQGWSVVDNTTGTDWINVRLSLIAGSPQSFIQPLSRPIYSARPEIPIAQDVQLAPQTFDSAITGGQGGSGASGTVTDASGAVVPNATITATNTATGAVETRTTDSQGRFSMSLPAGSYRLEASATGFTRLVENNVMVNGSQYASLNMPLQVGSASQTVEVTAGAPMVETQNAVVAMARNYSPSIINGYVSPKARTMGGPLLGGGMAGLAAAPPPPPRSYEDIAAGSFIANTQNNAFDDFFAYNVTDPVTIHKNESSLVPILQAKVNAEPVTLVHSNGHSVSQPLRALWLTNNTGLTIDRGSFSIVEDGNFGGEGLLDPIHPNEKRLLSYAADQAVHVSTENTGNQSRVVRITASRGVLIIQRAEHTDITYLVRNASAETRTVVLEHPITGGYTLDPGAKPDETTPTAYRFRITAPAGQTVRLPVPASHQGSTTYALASSDDNQLAYIVQQGNNDPKLAAALQPILDARRRVADAQAAVDATDTELDNLHKDEDRQRANITALNSADKASRDRFVHDLNATEDKIVATQKELDTRTAALEAAKTDLANRIETLQFDDTI